MVFIAAEPLCDPLTQEEREGECCKKCGPGTSMKSKIPCEDPMCTECEENEYMETYTTDAKCQRQPYCDPNKNFQWVTHMSKKKRHTCLCKVGFHCSSETCITCVSHTVCKAGYEAFIKGNQTHDTVCRKCPDGTFSATVSWDDVCQKKTECPSGYEPQEGGDESDTICVEKRRLHTGLICAVVVGIAVAVISFSLCFFCKDKTGYAKQKVKACLEAQNEDNTELDKEKTFPITTPTNDHPGSLLISFPSQEEGNSTSPEEGTSMAPEENEETGLTVNGNVLTQEGGKETILSQPETNETIVTF